MLCYFITPKCSYKISAGSKFVFAATRDEAASLFIYNRADAFPQLVICLEQILCKIRKVFFIENCPLGIISESSCFLGHMECVFLRIALPNFDVSKLESMIQFLY